MTRPQHLVVVVGTATEVGKTWASVRLLEEASSRGIRVAARKPVQSFDPGDDSATHDRNMLALATGENPSRVCPDDRSYPLAMAPPMAADALDLPALALSDLVDELRWEPDTGLGLVETAGGVASPVAHDASSVDLARRLEPDLVLLVADAGLGTINSVRLSLVALAPLPVVVLLNRFDPASDLHRRNREWLQADGVPLVIELAEVLDRLP